MKSASAWGQYSKSLCEYLSKRSFEYLITVCADAEAKCPSTWPGVQHRPHRKFDDPVAEQGWEERKLAKFRQARDQIYEAVRAWVAEQRREHAAVTTRYPTTPAALPC